MLWRMQPPSFPSRLGGGGKPKDQEVTVASWEVQHIFVRQQEKIGMARRIGPATRRDPGFDLSLGGEHIFSRFAHDTTCALYLFSL